jgi:hypothetical protein
MHLVVVYAVLVHIHLLDQRFVTNVLLGDSLLIHCHVHFVQKVNILNLKELQFASLVSLQLLNLKARFRAIIVLLVLQAIMDLLR